MVAYLVSALVLSQMTMATETAASVTVKVDGDGYLRFAREGELVYAKQATLTVAGGKLAAKEGPTVLPTMLVDGRPDAISVDAKGNVIVFYGTRPSVIGRLAVAQFAEDIRPVESRGFLMAYGPATIGEAGEDGFGRILEVKEPEEGTVSVRLVNEKTAVAGDASDANGGSNEGRAEIKVYLPDEEISDKASARSKATTDARYQPDLAFLQSGGVRVVLSDEIEVEGETIYLGAVATIYANADLSPKVSALNLGATPVFGVPRILTAARVMTALQSAGLSRNMIEIVGTDRSRVVRKGQTVTHQQFIDTAILAATERFAGFEAQTDDMGPELALPMGEIQFMAENVAQSGNTVTVRVAVFVDGKRINSRSVKLYNQAVPVNLRTGMTVRVLVKANDVAVETSGRVRRIDGVTGDVSVEIDGGTMLIGRANKQGVIEVQA